MNEINQLPSSLPATESPPFIVDLVGSITKQRFVGEFVCRIPTIEDQAKIAIYEAKLNGEFPVYVNAGVLKIHKQIAYLKYTLIDIPRFWREANNGYALRDPNVIEAVYEEVMTFESKWYTEIWGEDIVNGSNKDEEEKA